MGRRRGAAILVVAIALAACGDNDSPGRQRAVTDSNVSGAMVARSRNYQVVSTVTSGRQSAASSAHAARVGVAAQRGDR